MLVEYPHGGHQHAAIGLRARGADLGDGELAVDGVAGTHRSRPAQLVEPGRAHAAGAKDAEIEEGAEAERHGLEAAGDQPTIIARLRRLDIEMERLRIVAQGEIEDHALAHRDTGRDEALADGEILEIAIAHRRQPTPSRMERLRSSAPAL